MWVVSGCWEDKVNKTFEGIGKEKEGGRVKGGREGGGRKVEKGKGGGEGWREGEKNEGRERERSTCRKAVKREQSWRKGGRKDEEKEIRTEQTITDPLQRAHTMSFCRYVKSE